MSRTLSRTLPICILAACSGGGGDAGSPPVANPDAFTVIENTPTALAVLGNDTDPDGDLNVQGGITITQAPAGGTTEVNGGNVTFTPPDNFTGSATFRYRVSDLANNTSNETTVSITVEPVTITQTLVQPINVPTNGYASRNSAALGGTVLSSDVIPFEMPPNTVSFGLILFGDAVKPNNNGLIISDLADPDGLAPDPFQRHVLTCDTLLCVAYMPRRPGQTMTRGTWHFRLGTTAADLNNIDFDTLNLRLVARTGPAPDAAETPSARLRVKPWLTATSVSAADLDAILAEFVAIGAGSGLEIELAPTTVLTEARFTEVSADFSNPDTAALVEMGAAPDVNIFFLESFTGVDGAGRIGIAPGLPGTVSIPGNLNGVLINATITAGTPNHARTTAEFAFHEMGHFLGLFHTTEKRFSGHDVLDDTPQCLASDDTNANGDADVDECDDGLNIMFWSNDFDQPKLPLSSDQQHVLIHSPLAAP